MAEPEDERVEELSSLEAIFPEIVSDQTRFTADLELTVTPSKPLLVRFLPGSNGENASSDAVSSSSAHVEQDVHLEHLPSLLLHIALPDNYPANAPPHVRLASKKNWLPDGKLQELEQDAAKLWAEYGRCQILYSYIDHLQQASERGFDLDQSSEGCLVLPGSLEPHLISFDAERKLAIFRAGTYECGICLEPKKGTACYKMEKCGHVFCLNCLKDCYNNSIAEGDIRSVRCLDPTCGKEPNGAPNRKRRKRERILQPRELLAMGIEETNVRRYVEIKRKKKLEADKSTVYCPRTWCQGPAKSAKYPPIPADLITYTVDSDEGDSDAESHSTRQDSARPVLPHPADRLAVCESCSLAFCRVCYMGWHGEFARCFPRDPHELSAEEKASYDYIRLHTSPCPTCASPTQKTMGCNHMRCFQCNTHFCYLCGAWLNGENPYTHFNQPGRECYQRLWELEEGDEGQGPGSSHLFHNALYIYIYIQFLTSLLTDDNSSGRQRLCRRPGVGADGLRGGEGG